MDGDIIFTRVRKCIGIVNTEWASLLIAEHFWYLEFKKRCPLPELKC